MATAPAPRTRKSSFGSLPPSEEPFGTGTRHWTWRALNQSDGPQDRRNGKRSLGSRTRGDGPEAPTGGDGPTGAGIAASDPLEGHKPRRRIPPTRREQAPSGARNQSGGKPRPSQRHASQPTFGPEAQARRPGAGWKEHTASLRRSELRPPRRALFPPNRPSGLEGGNPAAQSPSGDQRAGGAGEAFGPRRRRGRAGPAPTGRARVMIPDASTHRLRVDGRAAECRGECCGPLGSRASRQPLLRERRRKASEPSMDQAQGSIGQPIGGNVDGLATDFAVEQYPEVGRMAGERGPKRGNTGGPPIKSQNNGERGPRRGDAARPAARGKAS
jgi:hypothetical protein